MPPRPLLLLLDFDSTLTLSSTIPLLLSLSPSPSPHPSLPSLTTAYTSDLASHTSRYRPKKISRKTVASELAYLTSLSPIEKNSIERLENAGIWKGITRERIEDVAVRAVRSGEVKLRKGWRDLVAEVQRRGGGKGRGKVCVVSVGWSRLFISACLREAANQEERGGDGAGGGVKVDVEVEVGDIDIRSNELVFDGEGKGTGKLDRYFSSSSSSEEEETETGIWTAADKLLVMHELISKSVRENNGGAVRPWIVYIGDSATDLGCLMEADVGVCVRDEGEMTGEQGGLREVVERCGVGCLHVGEWKGRMERGDEERKCLWWAREFEEVRRGILDGG